MKGLGRRQGRGRITVASLVVAAGILGLGYLLAIGRPLDQEVIYVALLAGFVICDSSFWPSQLRRKRSL